MERGLFSGEAMVQKLIILGFWIIWTAGCAPTISQEILKSADRQVGFESILKNPFAHRGKNVLLGGAIIKTTPLPGQTRMIVLQHSLGYRDKPSKENPSLGRFILSAPGFLDPAIYRAGRLVTIVGTVKGEETRPLGEIQYTYPLLENKELYLWPEEQNDNRPRIHFGIGVGKSF